jgi:hypothetical protein
MAHGLFGGGGNPAVRLVTFEEKHMAKTSGNGSVAIVEAIRALGDRLDRRIVELAQLMGDTNVRLDKLVENTGAHWRQPHPRNRPS